MPGLLDFLQTPAGQGLLSGVATYAAGARRGAPINSLGKGLVGGLTGYVNANDQLRQDEENKYLKEYRQLQMGELRQKQADRDAYRKQFTPGTLQPFQPDDPFNEGAATFGKDNLFTGEKPTFAGQAIDPKLAAIAPFLDPKEMYSAIAPKDPIKLGAGETLLDPTTKQPIISLPKADPEKDRLYAMMQAAGIDPESPQGQTVISNWITKQTTHPPSFQWVQGDGYTPSGVFDPRQGRFTTAPGGMQPPQEAPDPMAPWKHMPPKKADQMRAQLYTSESKKLDDLREQVAKGDAVLRDLERFGQLNQGQATGGVIDKLSMVPTFDEDKQEMQAIASRLAPQARPAGSGTTSDRDLSLYLQSLPGIDKPGNVNANIRTQFQTAHKDAQAKLDFAERYFAEKGHLNGWAAAWENSKKNPAPARDNGKSGVLDRGEILNEELRTALASGDQQNARLIREEMRRMGVKEGGAQQARVAPPKPKPGAVVDGYRFLGGDPSNPKMWAKVKQ